MYEERPVPPWDTPNTPVMEEVGIEGRRAILIVPVVIWVPLIVMFASVTAGKVPDVIFEASRSGMSDAANALKVGTPDVEVGAANTVPVACDTRVAVLVPDEVTGDPDTEKMSGNERPTEDTVPASIHERIPPVVPERTWPSDVGVDVGKVSVLEANLIC